MRKMLFLLYCAIATFAVASIAYGAGAEESGAGIEASSSETLDIKWRGFNLQGVYPKQGSVIQKILEEKYDIRIENVQVDIYNAEQVSVQLATGVEFDIHTFNAPDVNSFLDTGLIRELPEEYVRSYAPTLYKILNEATPDGFWKRITSVDGTLYGIPWYGIYNTFPLALTVRSDWMESVGATMIPATLQDLESLFVKFRQNDPDGNGKKDTYAINNWDGRIAMVAPYVFASYGISMFYSWQVGEDGEPVHWAIHDGYRSGLAVLADWYQKEIFDPEIVIDTRQTAGVKFANGVFGGYWSPERVIEPDTDPASPWNGLVEKRPEVEAVHIPPVKGPNGDALTSAFGLPFRTTSGIYFGAKTSDEKVIRLLQMLNDIYSDNSLLRLVHYGVEGEHFSLDEKGGVVPNPQYSSNEDRTDVGMLRFVHQQWMGEQHVQVAFNSKRFEVWNKVRDYQTLPVHSLNLLLTDSERIYGTALRTLQDEFFWKVFTGEWNLNDRWDAYVSQWLAAGGQTVIDEKAEQWRKLSAGR